MRIESPSMNTLGITATSDRHGRFSEGWIDAQIANKAANNKATATLGHLRGVLQMAQMQNRAKTSASGHLSSARRAGRCARASTSQASTAPIRSCSKRRKRAMASPDNGQGYR